MRALIKHTQLLGVRRHIQWLISIAMGLLIIRSVSQGLRRLNWTFFDRRYKCFTRFRRLGCPLVILRYEASLVRIRVKLRCWRFLLIIGLVVLGLDVGWVNLHSLLIVSLHLLFLRFLVNWESRLYCLNRFCLLRCLGLLYHIGQLWEEFLDRFSCCLKLLRSGLLISIFVIW